MTISSEDVPIGLVRRATSRSRRRTSRSAGTARSAARRRRSSSTRSSCATLHGDGRRTSPPIRSASPRPTSTMSTELSLFGVGIPGRRGAHALAPSRATSCSRPRRCSSRAPRSPPTALREQFGGLADAVLRDWTVCIARVHPRGLTLTAVAVDGDAARRRLRHRRRDHLRPRAAGERHVRVTRFVTRMTRGAGPDAACPRLQGLPGA